MKSFKIFRIVVISVILTCVLTSCGVKSTDADTGTGSLSQNEKSRTDIPGGNLPDWDEIRSKEPDAAAVIRIEGQEGDEIVSSEKDGIHIDEGNDTELTDPLTIIYGSEMISALGDPDVFSKHPHIYVYREDEMKEYSVFATMNGDDSDVLLKNNAYDYNEFQKFVDGIYSSRSMGANFDKSMEKQVIKTWQTLMITDGAGNGKCFIVYATVDKTYTL